MNRVQTALLAAILVVLAGIGFEFHRFNGWLRGGMLVPRAASIAAPDVEETREQRQERLRRYTDELAADFRASLAPPKKK